MPGCCRLGDIGRAALGQPLEAPRMHSGLDLAGEGEASLEDTLRMDPEAAHCRRKVDRRQAAGVAPWKLRGGIRSLAVP
jgi:hypothetical protein